MNLTFEQIVEKNKIIAEFMGLWYAEEGFLYHPQFERGYAPNDLLFHSSWDWLMPVCRKLLLHFNGSDFEDIHETLQDVLPSCVINIIYETCVEFILEINKDKQK